ncbi:MULTISPECIES: hypothetical protein [Paraburkholderia]|uniref:hypothetical protein n=1 Tax=Paraburkholderia TaxID=1822464 RepID=UPI0002553580|nr:MULTISPECIES: hypothetical protein [Paraburkholderia]MDR8396294.1 hypothetical protein [Paraburkholderia sp. USG1]
MLVSPIKSRSQKRLRFFLNAAAGKIRRYALLKNSKGKKDARKTALRRETQGRSRSRVAMRRQQNDGYES